MTARRQHPVYWKLQQRDMTMSSARLCWKRLWEETLYLVILSFFVGSERLFRGSNLESVLNFCSQTFLRSHSNKLALQLIRNPNSSHRMQMAQNPCRVWKGSLNLLDAKESGALSRNQGKRNPSTKSHAADNQLKWSLFPTSSSRKQNPRTKLQSFLRASWAKVWHSTNMKMTLGREGCVYRKVMVDFILKLSSII